MPLVYLVSTAQAVATAKVAFAFTDGHATMAFTEFFDDLACLCRIDWGVMQSQYWFDSEQYPDRKRRRQAEFLVYEHFPVSLITEIAVQNIAVQDRVVKMLADTSMNATVHVRPDWYY